MPHHLFYWILQSLFVLLRYLVGFSWKIPFMGISIEIPKWALNLSLVLESIGME